MFKEKNEIEIFYKNLRFGTSIKLKRDLSNGRLEEDMIQDLSIKVFRENRELIYILLTSYPILEMEVLDY